ncbi:MAG: potassium channel family protein [Candidatus Orphnella occulta]|nr:potassium channel family protein [Candidatus Orphnella occulta]
MPHIKGKTVIQDRFVHLLVVLLSLFLLYPFFQDTEATIPVVPLVFLISIVLILRALRLHKTIFKIYIAIAALAYLADVLFALEKIVYLRELFSLITALIYAVFLVMAIIAITKKLFSVRKVSTDTIIGGICVYILLGFLWALFYYLIYCFDKGAFSLQAQGANPNLFYFSFITLTTTGYGDIFPLDKVAMVLASLEAVVGQIYLAVLIARLVGLHVINQMERDIKKS